MKKNEKKIKRISKEKKKILKEDREKWQITI